MIAIEHGTHELSALAQVAFSHGLFHDLIGDKLIAPLSDPRGESFLAWLNRDGCDSATTDALFPLNRYSRLREVYRAFVAAGRTLARDDGGSVVRGTLQRLSCAGGDWRSLVAKIALSHGVLLDAASSPRLRDERTLWTLLVLGVAPTDSLYTKWRAYRQSLLQRGFRRRAGLSW